MSWTRPDGILLGGMVACQWAVLRRRADDALRAAVVVGLWPLAAVVAQLAFRVLYYRDLVPAPARAKLAFTATRLSTGLAYVEDAAIYLMPLWAFSIVAAILAASAMRRSRRLSLVAGASIAWPVYVVVIGGDIFPAHRHVVPVLVLSAFALSELLRLLSAFSSRGVVVSAAIAAVVPAMLVHFAGSDPQARRAVDERWEWDGKIVGEFLRDVFGGDAPLLAVDSAGCLPFFSALPSLDMLGLNDRFLAENRPSNMGRGRLGHELGNGSYVLDRNPDLVLFCSPTGGVNPCFRSGRQMVQDARWPADYRPVTFEVRSDRTIRALLFARTVGSKAGARFDGERVRIPPFVFTGTAGFAFRDGGTIAASLPQEHSAQATLTLPRAGRYSVAIEATGGPVALSATGSVGSGGTVIDAPSTRCRMTLETRGPAVVRQIVLTPTN